MKLELQNTINRFAELSQTYKSLTKWDSRMMDKLCALQCICSGREADLEGYQRSKEYIKKNAGLFASVKGEMLPVAAWQMAAEADGELFFQKMQSCYKTLKEKGFASGNYLVVAALYLARTKSEAEFESVSEKMKKLFQAMRKSHPLATGQEDYTAAAMLAVSGITVPEFQQRLSRIEDLLRNWISRGNRLQSISNMILLFHVDDIALCERAINLYQAFKERGYNFNSHDMTALLALLAISKVPAGELADEIIEASDYLKEKKGFGSLSMDKCQRAMMVSGLYLTEEFGRSEETELSSVAVQSMVIDYLIALQTMCVCCIVATSAAAAASSSN